MARRNGVSAPSPGPPRARRDEVYRAALRLFREKGYHATSMQDIAGALGLYKGSLYHYIGGKEDLLVQAFEQAMRILLANAERVVADASLTPSVQLRLIVLAHVQAVAENLDALTVYFHEFRALADESLANVRAQHERYARLVSEIVSRGVGVGEFETADVGIATLALLGMCNGVCQWYRPGGRLGPGEIGGYFADLVLGALGQPNSTAISWSPGPTRPAFRRTSE